MENYLPWPQTEDTTLPEMTFKSKGIIVIPEKAEKDNLKLKRNLKMGNQIIRWEGIYF